MRRWNLERVSGPSEEPISVAEFVRNAGEFSAAASARTADIERLITSARLWIEKNTGRALIDQTWRLTIAESPRIAGEDYDTVRGTAVGCTAGIYAGRMSEILLMRSPVIAITSFVSVDAAGVETTIDPTTYELREADSKWPKLVGLNGASWTTGTYRITLRAGYVNNAVSPPTGAVPANLEQAILLHAQAHYDAVDPAAMKAMLEAAEMLIEQDVCHLRFA